VSSYPRSHELRSPIRRRFNARADGVFPPPATAWPLPGEGQTGGRSVPEAVERVHLQRFRWPEKFTLVALGGYGRGTLLRSRT